MILPNRSKGQTPGLHAIRVTGLGSRSKRSKSSKKSKSDLRR